MYPVAVDQSRRPVRSRWRRNAGDAEGLAWDGDGGDIEQGQLNNGQGIAGSVVGGGAIVLSEEGNCDIENKQKDGQDEQFPVSGEVCFFLFIYNWLIRFLAVSTGMANPIPILPPLSEKMKVLIPITSPRILISGPPELPGLMAASVWIMFL